MIVARLLLLWPLFAPLGPAARQSGYTVSWTHSGVRLTVHLQRRDFPRRALIAVTDTVRNISHRDLAVEKPREAFGACSWPDVSIVPVDAHGAGAEPAWPIPQPVFPCPAPLPFDLPVGHSLVEHQLVVLWSGRLQISAQLFNHDNGGYWGFALNAPPLTVHLHAAPAPTIRVRTVNGESVATVTPPAGAHGPLYIRSWGSCSSGGQPTFVYYWTARTDNVVPSGCTGPLRWHLDAGWIGSPVADLNLGATGAPPGTTTPP